MEMRMLEVVAVNYWIYARAGNFLIKMSGITNIFKKCKKIYQAWISTFRAMHMVLK